MQAQNVAKPFGWAMVGVVVWAMSAYGGEPLAESAERLLKSAETLMISGEYGEALKVFQSPPLAGNAEALYQQAEILGMDEDELISVKPDAIQARLLYKKAADMGHTEAAFRLGQSYYFDADTAENRAQTILWWRVAASKGHAGAAFYLADLFIDSPSAERLQEAGKFLEPLTRNEDDAGKAHFLLGKIYRKGPEGEPDYAKAVDHFRKAADLGMKIAKSELAFHHVKGLGVEKDLNRALALLEEANKDSDFFDEPIEAVKKMIAEEGGKDSEPAVVAPEADAAMVKRLVGKWKSQSHAGGVKVTGTTQYHADGRFHSQASTEVNGAKRDILFEGQWRIEVGQLLCEITKSNDQEMMPDGTKTSDTILSLDETQFKYQDENGDVFVETLDN